MSASRNLVVFYDGTGNDRTIGDKTNVAKLSDRALNGRVTPNRSGGPKPWQDLAGEALDAEVDRPEIAQLTHYIPGVGSEWGDLVGKATGSGISQRIQSGYDFVARFYRPGDRIWLIGFSRGAYTARSLGGLIGMCGVPDRTRHGQDLRHDHGLRKRIVEEAYTTYKIGSGEGEPGRVRRAAGAASFRQLHAYREHSEADARAPYFIGVWDTVRSLGVPFRSYDIEVLNVVHRFHDHELSPHVAHAYHALAIDEMRVQFHPTLWNEPTLFQLGRGRPARGDQSFEQVWFPGVHADVGGGYAVSGLSDIALVWMIERAIRAKHPMLFNVGNPTSGLAADPMAHMHDSREGAWRRFLYQRMPRSIVKGVQDSESKAVARRHHEPADLDGSWETRLGDPAYDTPHLRGHERYDRIRP